jgi:hypothetical protein
LNDLEHAKILSICCVMTRTLQGWLWGKLVKVNENWNVDLCQRDASRLKMFLVHSIYGSMMKQIKGRLSLKTY